MKFGMRKPSFKKSIKARTTGKLERNLKKAVIPGYGKKGSGFIKDPEKSIYNKVYNKTTFGIQDVFNTNNTENINEDTTNTDTTEKVKNHISFERIIAWFFTFICFASILASHFCFASFLFFILALFIMPTISEKFNFSNKMKWSVFAAVFILAMALNPKTTQDAIDTNLNSANTIATSISDNSINTVTNEVANTTNTVSENTTDSSENTVANTASTNTESSTTTSTKTESKKETASAALVVAATTTAPTPAPTPTSTSSSSVSDNRDDEETVYIGKTGTKYHRQSCKTLKGKGTAISLKDAKAAGREPCAVCNP